MIYSRMNEITLRERITSGITLQKILNLCSLTFTRKRRRHRVAECIPNVRKMSYSRFSPHYSRSLLEPSRAYDAYEVTFGLERISVSSRIMKVNARKICSSPLSFRAFPLRFHVVLRARVVCP